MKHPALIVALAALGVAAVAIAPNAISAESAATPSADGSDYEARFDAAIALHDRGQYGAAISAFRDLLATRPDDPTLLCELANSLFASGRSDEAVQRAESGLAQPGANDAFCSNILGSALDARGDLKKGEKVFRKAIRKSPDVAILHFNLGVNQSLQKHPEEAIEEFQEAIRLKPSHASNWRALALAWQERRMRPRAFTAFARFLALEPVGTRAEGAARQLEALLFQGVENKGADPATGKESISITTDADAGEKSDAARGLDLSMSIVTAGRWLDEWKTRTDAEFFAHAFDAVLKIFEELDDSSGRKDGFWSAAVMPYFRDARAAEHIETMAWEVRRSRNDPEVMAWLEAHAAQVESYRAWAAAWTPR